MSSNLSSVHFIDLLPENMRENIRNICFAKTFDVLYPEFKNKIQYVRFLSRVDTLSSTQLDLLATELHVDVYDGKWTLSQKIESCKNSIKWHIYKGTPFILDDFIKKIYGKAELQEWFQYCGLSYHFKILVELFNEANDSNTIKKISEAVTKYKNQRSKLDNIEVQNIILNNQRFLIISKTECEIFVLNKG